ncbi:MAG: hypothetical protein ACODAJ_12305, partial [Planctomycetota bacterium]
AVVLPYIVPLPMVFAPSPSARQLYDRVEALQQGSVVLFSFDYDPSAMAELYPMSLALLRHCFDRDLKPIVMTHWPNGVGLCRQLIEKTAVEAGKTTGQDYVFLGYKPGYSDLVLNMGESIKVAFDRDFYGKATEGMGALEGIDSLKDVPLVVDIAAGQTPEMWILYGGDRFGFDLGVGCTAVIAPDLYPFLQSGQLCGFLGGLRGAADYETLIDVPEDATKGMQAQSLTHVLIIALILGANISYVWRRVTRGEQE